MNDNETKQIIAVIVAVGITLSLVIDSVFVVNRKVFRNADDEVKVIQAKATVEAQQAQQCGDIGGVWKGYYCDYPDAK